MALNRWIDAGLLASEHGDDSVAPRVKLLPIGDLVLASDKPQRWTHDARPDFVMAPGLTTVELAHATLRKPSKRTLDVGTGCGALGLLSASHSREVVATDTNTRALDYTAFNARLNGIDSVNCRVGSLFEPVAAEERFDLIVSNPPFVISPTKRFAFRDAGMRGDEFCMRFIRAVPTHMAPGGFCQLKCNFAHHTGEDWAERLTAWFEGLGCDVLVWVERVEDASAYAMTWIVGTESHDLDKVPVIYQQWMDYFDQEKIEAISYLLITMRRTGTRRNWTRIDDVPRQIAASCSEELLKAFALQDNFGWIRTDSGLLDTRPRLAADIHIQQEHAMAAEGLQAMGTRLYKTGGSQYTMHVEPYIGSLAARFNGRRSVRDVLAEMALAFGKSAESMQDQGLTIVRSLLDRGILEPQSSPTEHGH
jgi:cyclopropane fatty-acyl-phospholipid synthase-like methyltransferase